MHPSLRGAAAPAILSSLLVATLFAAGCRQGGSAGQQEAGAAPATTQPQSRLPQTTRQVVARQSLEVPPEMAEIPPVATLPPEQQRMFYNAMGPLRLRVSRGDGSVVAESDVRSGEILTVDRRDGIRLSRQDGSEQLVRGPLDDRAAYSLYALPVGGVRRESERSVIRPETPEELEARLKAQEEERRRAAEEAATRPAGSGGG